MKTAAFFGDPSVIQSVYGPEALADVRRHARVIEPVIDLKNFDSHHDLLRTVDVIFSTWSMPRLESHHLDRMPALRAVFYAAGTVKDFAEPLLDRNIVVVSAARMNAVPTAEFAFAQILLSMKGCFRNQREYRNPAAFHTAFRGAGNYGESIALLGFGAIGSRVAEMLKPMDVKVLAYDPYLSDERAAAFGVERVTLEEAFARAYVISNHMPRLPETEGILGRDLFSSMRPDATFINTARGSIVDEAGMLSVLTARPDLQAILDVTHPEPPPEGSPLYSLPNVFLTTHIAGAVNDELRRLGWACAREFEAWKDDRPLQHAVTRESLARMA